MSIRSGSSGYAAIPVHNNEERNNPVNRQQQPINQNTSFVHKLQRYSRSYKKRHIPLIILGTIICFVFLLYGLVNWLPDLTYRKAYPITEPPLHPGISIKTLQQGLQKCKTLQNQQEQQQPDFTKNKRIYNPRVSNSSQPLLLKNAIVWDGEGQVLEDVDIFIDHGVIVEVKPDIQLPAALLSSTEVIDVRRHIVSPGLVDMHTHLGVDSWPALGGTNDVNEATDPITPFVRTIDAFNPSDKAIRIVASGGVTTALVLPGSANLIGGEAYVFKLRPVSSFSSEDMLVQANVDETVEKKWRYMKMACGENAKNKYGKQGRMPSTRLGEAFLFRKALSEGQKLIQAQEDWCNIAELIKDGKAKEATRLESAFPEQLELESLAALLRGQVKLNIHCYQTHDIEAMLRHAEEFDFEIAAFHHALEAYKIPDILKKRHRQRNNITIATFADHWGYKTEAYAASPFAAKILHDASIPVAFKSDHPVLNSQHLALEAAKSTHYGLPTQEAFKAITSVPAKALGLHYRIGSLKAGYDADLVIWDREPLELGATPLQVFIDGIPQFDKRLLLAAVERDNTEKRTQYNAEATVDKYAANIPQGSKSFVLTNVGATYLHPRSEDDSNGEGSSSLTIVIQNGQIVCSAAADEIYSTCASIKANSEDNHLVETIDIHGGYLLPGLIAVGSKLGLAEIPSEISTTDGIIPSGSSSITEAIDGLKFGGKKLKEAYRGGVLTAVTAPISNDIIMGISAAFKTTADSKLEENSIVKSAAALHVQIGHSIKSDSFPTISSQIAFLRKVFNDNHKEQNYFGQAARGELPLIVTVNNKDEIASIIQLKNTIIPQAKVAIMGGAEAYLLAPHLRKAKIAVILRPYLCTPEDFASSHCLTGAPLTNGTAAHILHSYGVKLAIGVSDDGWARNLAWDAGWLAATSPPAEDSLAISEQEALSFITTNLEEIFGLVVEDDIIDGKREKNPPFSTNNFVVWSGNPFHLQSRPMLTFSATDGLQKV